MKKIIVICCLAIGAIFSFDSCSPYYYDRGYVSTPRVYVRSPIYYSTPYRPVYRQHYRRNYRRY